MAETLNQRWVMIIHLGAASQKNVLRPMTRYPVLVVISRSIVPWHIMAAISPFTDNAGAESNHDDQTS
jgi:hypothetical protein